MGELENKPKTPSAGVQAKDVKPAEKKVVKATPKKKAVKVMYTKECPQGHSHATVEFQQELVMEAAKHLLSQGVIKVSIKKGKDGANDVHTVQFV